MWKRKFWIKLKSKTYTIKANSFTLELFLSLYFQLYFQYPLNALICKDSLSFGNFFACQLNIPGSYESINLKLTQ